MTSFELFASWQFLEAELAFHDTEAEKIIIQVISQLQLSSAPETMLGLCSIISRIPVTPSLIFALLMVNPEGDVAVDLIRPFYIKHQIETISFIRAIITQFINKEPFAEDPKKQEETACTVFINLSKLIKKYPQDPILLLQTMQNMKEAFINSSEITAVLETHFKNDADAEALTAIHGLPKAI